MLLTATGGIGLRVVSIVCPPRSTASAIFEALLVESAQPEYSHPFAVAYNPKPRSPPDPTVL
jgi:hypothetical protein